MRGAPFPPKAMPFAIDFQPIGRRGPCPEGGSLLDAARALGVDLVNICGGAGTCARCRVQVLTGRVSEPTAVETEALQEAELAQGLRLACQTFPLDDCRIGVPADSLTAPQRAQVNGLADKTRPEPLVRAWSLEVRPPDLEDQRADADRLLAALAEKSGIQNPAADLAVLRVFSPRLRAGDWRARVVTRGNEVVGFGSEPSALLGLAVDLGTTKIAAYLVDLTSGHTLAARGVMNPQIAYGEDVISRLSLALKGPAEAARLKDLVIETLNALVQEMCVEVEAKPEAVVEAVIVGNTAMHHLLVGLPVDQLARAPYVPSVQTALDVKARDLGLKTAPGAYVHLLPNIAGFVGADHVAMLLATRPDNGPGVRLALDIGTNTEVCLAGRDFMASVSCASGPAFEGAHIRHGMRAAPGAIERVKIEGDRPTFQVIGGGPPAGLCGSGILDALAQLHLAGVIDASGRLGEHARVRTVDNVKEFVLVEEAERSGGPAITLTQKDVRELQMAKAAIRAGIEILMAAHGVGPSEIDGVIIAGAFGSYIDVDSALTIGLLPPMAKERVVQVGNAAGSGAKMALISAKERAQAEALARRIRYIELATAPRFMDVYTQAMLLG